MEKRYKKFFKILATPVVRGDRERPMMSEGSKDPKIQGE
jgi:hypothetical protein